MLFMDVDGCIWDVTDVTSLIVLIYLNHIGLHKTASATLLPSNKHENIQMSQMRLWVKTLYDGKQRLTFPTYGKTVPALKDDFPVRKKWAS